MIRTRTIREAAAIFTGPIGELNRFGEVLIGFLRFLCFLCHKAFPSLISPRCGMIFTRSRISVRIA